MGKILVAILTASDKGSRGEREDRSAQVIRELVAGIDGEVVAYDVVPDERKVLAEKLVQYADLEQVELFLFCILQQPLALRALLQWDGAGYSVILVPFHNFQLVEVAVFGRKFYLIFNRPAFCLVLRRDAGIDCYSVHYHITSI